KGVTPLHVTSHRRDETVARVLLDKVADVSAMNDAGDTPLLDAAGQGDDLVVRLLLERGADVTAKNLTGLAPLHIHFAAFISGGTK
ncbi:ankyrin repeat-containing domain protein, partial [Baffinella frigidus]